MSTVMAVVEFVVVEIVVVGVGFVVVEATALVVAPADEIVVALVLDPPVFATDASVAGAVVAPAAIVVV